MVATTFGGFAADYLGWTAPFVIGGLVGMVGLVLSAGIRENREAQSQPIEVKELLQVGSDRILLSAAFLAILVQVLNFSTLHGFTPVYAMGIGASKSQLSILSLVQLLPAAITSLKSGDWAQRFGTQRVVAAGFVLVSVFTLMIPFCQTVTGLFVTQALAGFGRGVIFPLLMGLSIRYIDNSKRATAMGFFQSIYSLGMFGGPVLVGAIGDSLGLTGGFVTVGIIGLVAAGLTLYLLRAQRFAHHPSVGA